MNIQNFYNLKNKDTITNKDLSPLKYIINENFPNINFDNSNTTEGIPKNTKIMVNNLYSNIDGYYTIFIYSISFKREQIALFLLGGENGRSSTETYITNKTKYIEAMIYLESLFSELNISDVNEELEELNWFHARDMMPVASNINLKFNVKVGDIILVDIEYNNEDGIPTLYKQIRAKITKLKNNTFVDPVSIVLLDYKLGYEFFMSYREHLYYDYILPLYDVFKEPKDWEATNSNQKKYLKEVFCCSIKDNKANIVFNYEQTKKLGLLINLNL